MDKKLTIAIIIILFSGLMNYNIPSNKIKKRISRAKIGYNYIEKKEKPIGNIIIPKIKVNPIATCKACAITKHVAAKNTWTTYNNGATNKKENSIGSVIPVNALVKAAESNKLAVFFFASGFAHWYMAKAAPGKPKIININSPEKNLVAFTLKWVTLGSDNCAKKIFCAPDIIEPFTICTPPTALW